jgi:hypothetical protein
MILKISNLEPVCSELGADANRRRLNVPVECSHRSSRGNDLISGLRDLLGKNS